MILRLGLALLLVLLSPVLANAHDARPAYLDIRELQAGHYEVTWKVPLRAELAPGLGVRWPDVCSDMVPGSRRAVPGAIIERRLLDCGAAGLAGQRIAIEGLDATRSDTLVRVEFLAGTVQTSLVKPATPWVDIARPQSSAGVAGAYFVLGVEHIVFGIDHLLFVLGLTLIVRGAVLLVKTITAFTIAHSITLALATLGYAEAPQAPVEAVIALSIVFLASELARMDRGMTGLAVRAPWLVAFAFGLLHGFGFAGALSEVGLPQSDVPLALLTFNLGVEAGQLLFVAFVLAFAWAAGRTITAPAPWLRQAPAYAIGSLAAFWLLERIAGIA